ncbi:putative flap endonuclease-1-like 5' DNA nuclease [Hoeflea marina]|uniref:Putative flap endonuclease-1-like 5' DNA nuclease n=1 Tax=Hoeflea marina TaxID=274592 RepID=A0A317PUH2_9HYPH|nr:hypothetical protein [Hoeflea marina]PWW04334.1 putative flap endonuclease-1-like 5' DNA nuclease [Hoeflea marina]
MSMFSYPTELSAEAMTKQMDAMSGWMKTADTAVPPVLAHPAAAVAAATALGFGVAGHMTGMMLGAMRGAMKLQADALAMQGRLLAASEDQAVVRSPAAPQETAGRDDVVPMARAASVIAGTAKPVASAAKKIEKAAGKAARQAAVAAPKSAAVDKLKSDADMAAAASVETAVAEVPVELKAPATAGQRDARPMLEPEDFHRPAEMERPETPDDLKAISGIGPKLEQVLNSLGIWTYAQVAAWKEAEIAWLDDYLQFKGRIDRDGWVEQAAEFARGSGAARD